MHNFIVIPPLCTPTFLFFYLPASTCFPHFNQRFFVNTALNTCVFLVFCCIISLWLCWSAALSLLPPSLDELSVASRRPFVHLLHLPTLLPFIRSYFSPLSVSFLIVSLSTHVTIPPFFRYFVSSFVHHFILFLFEKVKGRIFAISTEKAVVYYLNKILYHLDVERFLNVKIVAAFRALRTLRAFFLYTSESHWLKLCVRR